jgi:nicotinamide-nucleotide adenylyltransferase
MKTALFVARFQPLHKGHLHVIKSLIKMHRLVIAIGSTNKKGEENPFSFAIRKRMIQNSLKKYKGKYKIIGIKDVHNDKKWARSIERRAKFDFVVTGNAWVKRCFKNREIIKPKMYYPRKYKSTRIRSLIKKGKRWQHFVPEECVKIIEREIKHEKG